MNSLPQNPGACTTLSDVDARRLTKAGLAQWTDPRKTCVTCAKQGAFKMRQGGSIVEVQCDCVEQWKLHRWMLNAGIGMRYQRLSWEHATGVSPAPLDAVFTYIDSATRNVASGIGLTLGSPNTGTGKTLLSVLLAKGLLAAGHDVYFTQFNDMLDAFTAGWRDAEERAWFTRRVRNAGVLFVDDIGREHKGRSEVVESMFDQVIRHRVASSLPTIITTNYTEADMRQGLGHNVMSLLAEVNRYIECPGVDFRPKAQSRTLQDDADGVVNPITVS